MKKLIFYSSKIGVTLFFIGVILVALDIGNDILMTTRLVNLLVIIKTLLSLFVMLIIIVVLIILIYYTIKEKYNE